MGAYADAGTFEQKLRIVSIEDPVSVVWDPAATNNRMELTAAIKALNALRPVAIVTMIGARNMS